MDQIQIDVLGNLKFFLPQLIILGICLIYWIKLKTIDGFFLSLGSTLSFFILVYHLFLKPILWLQVENLHNNYQLDGILSVTSFLSSMAFIVGFLMLIMKQLKKSKTQLESRIERIE